jgi:hypothetical protein
VVSFQTGSRFRVDGNATLSFAGRTYADFEHNTAGPTQATGSDPLSIDNIIVTQGSMNFGMTGPFSVKGNVTVNSGATLNFNAGSNSTVSFNGSSPQTITATGSLTSAGAETFEVANASGVSIATNLILGGSVRFTNGKLTTGSNVLAITLTGTVVGAGQGTGWVNGNLRRNFSGSSALRNLDVGDANYYTPVRVQMSGLVGVFDLTARTDTPDHPSLAGSTIVPSTSVNRWWTLTPSGTPSFASFTGTFNFNAADVDAGANTGNFVVESYNGSTWSGPHTGTRTATSTQGTGFTAFGQFAVGEQVAAYTITASAGPGGTITPSGGVSVSGGGSQVFTIAADGCHTIANVDVDGASQGAIASYTFTNVTANHTISATFATTLYTINASKDGGGTISPEGDTQVGCSSNQAYTITPDPGFAVVAVVIDDGTDVGPVTSYTFTNVTAPHKIKALFGQTTAVRDIPKEFGLSAAWPNPSKGDASFSYAVAKESDVKLSIVDVTGRVIDVLAQGTVEPGRYTVKWGGRPSVAAGMYFVRFDAAGQRFTRRLIISH